MTEIIYFYLVLLILIVPYWVILSVVNFFEAFTYFLIMNINRPHHLNVHAFRIIYKENNEKYQTSIFIRHSMEFLV